MHTKMGRWRRDGGQTWRSMSFVLHLCFAVEDGGAICKASFSRMSTTLPTARSSSGVTNKPGQSHNALCRPCSGGLVRLAICMQIEPPPPFPSPLTHIYTHFPSCSSLRSFVLSCPVFTLFQRCNY